MNIKKLIILICLLIGVVLFGSILPFFILGDGEGANINETVLLVILFLPSAIAIFLFYTILRMMAVFLWQKFFRSKDKNGTMINK